MTVVGVDNVLALLLAFFFLLLFIEVCVEEYGEVVVVGLSCAELQKTLLVIGKSRRHVVAYRVVVACESGELGGLDDIGLYSLGLVFFLALLLSSCQLALRRIAAGRCREGYLKLRKCLDGIAVKPLGVFVAAVIHEA